jgi:hypothetical protein
MIGFIADIFTVITNYNSSPSMTACISLHSLLDYECLLFWVTDLILIYESVTYSASVHWLTLLSWTLNYWTAFGILLRMNDDSRRNRTLIRMNSRTIFRVRVTLRLAYSPYVTSSLTRRWICRLQLMMAFASAVILGSESRGNHDDILLSQIRNSPNLEGQVPVFLLPRN